MTDQPTAHVALQLAYTLCIVLRDVDPILKAKIDAALDDCLAVVAAQTETGTPSEFQTESHNLLAALVASIKDDR